MYLIRAFCIRYEQCLAIKFDAEGLDDFLSIRRHQEFYEPIGFVLMNVRVLFRVDRDDGIVIHKLLVPFEQDR